MVYEHPVYTHRALAAQRRPAGDLGRPRTRLLRRLPRLGVPRGRLRLGRAGGRWRWGALVTVGLYEGQVAHDRRPARRNRFRYGVYMWLVDVDELPRLARACCGRPPAGCDVRSRDHLGDPRPHDARATRRLPAACRASSRAAAACCCSPTPACSATSSTRCRCAGATARTATLRCVVAEVHNTHGAAPRLCAAAGRRRPSEADKVFEVSPFLAVDGRYRMSFARAGRAGGDRDGARAGRRAGVRGLADRHAGAGRHGVLARLLLRHPWMTLKVTALIRLHGHALSSAGAPCAASALPRRRPMTAADARSRPGAAPPHRRRRVRPDRPRAVPPRGGRASRGSRSCCPTAVPAPAAGCAAHDDPARGVLPPPRRARQDRLRRGVHGRRLGGRRPGRRARGLRPRLDPGAGAAAAAAAAWSTARPPTSDEHAGRRGAQHRAPLRPLERALRAVPGRDDDLLVRGLRARRRRSSRPSGASTSRLRPGRRAARTRVLEIGSGWGGLAIHAADHPRLPGDDRDDLAGQAAWRAQRVAAAGVADRVDGGAARLPRDRAAASTRSSRSRCSRPSASAYWPAFFATCDRLLAPGGRSRRCRRSPCPTLATWPPAARTRWMHKYVFPGGLIPSREAIDRAVRSGSRLRVDRRERDRAALRDDASAVARAIPRPAPTRCAALGFDGTFRADVGVLPGLLRGRIRHRARSATSSCGWSGT